ncbi:uncharacterized protein PAC_00376 [Phialocephala subalpina]|uniref:Uncharacterized protein n=1 Tax=Phialocephala subalpina TaxID=576137 RepID=A0A1L7WCI2_9HELO|nr:uncharacterized protein PAC_00376 [Phialocephala subalpina]
MKNPQEAQPDPTLTLSVWLVHGEAYLTTGIYATGGKAAGFQEWACESQSQGCGAIIGEGKELNVIVPVQGVQIREGVRVISVAIVDPMRNLVELVERVEGEVWA